MTRHHYVHPYPRHYPPPPPPPHHDVKDACRYPPPGRTYLTIGQDLFSIQEYVTEAYNYSLHQYMAAAANNTSTNNNQRNNITATATITARNKKEKEKKKNRSSRTRTNNVPLRSSVWPAAYMAYTDLEKLQGLDQPIDYGSGIEYASGLLLVGNGPRSGLQLGLWLGGSTGCRTIVDGVWNTQIQQFVEYIVTCPFPKVWIRVGYEFDNPGFGYTSSSAISDNENEDTAWLFRTAFARIVEACRNQHECADKALFVWHSWAAGGLPPNQTLQDYYPGDEVVDWIGISVFQQFYPNQPNTLVNVLEFAKAHHKPVMIAESTPFGGLDAALVDPWNEWFVPTLQLIDDYDIHMWSYINCNWESQPMWHLIGFGETRLSQNTTIQQLWHQHVLHNPRFYQHSSGPLCSSTDGNSKHDEYEYEYDYRHENGGNNKTQHQQHRAYSSWWLLNSLIPVMGDSSSSSSSQQQQQQQQYEQHQQYQHYQQQVQQQPTLVPGSSDTVPTTHHHINNNDIHGGVGSHFYTVSYYYWYAALLVVTVFWFVRFWLQQSLAATTNDPSMSSYYRQGRHRGGQRGATSSSWQQATLEHSPLFVRKLLSRIPEVSERDDEGTLADDIAGATRSLQEYGSIHNSSGSNSKHQYH